jgi:exosortase/archaeosortase family protein
VCDENIQQSPHPDLWALSWIGAGLATLVLLGSVALPPSCWSRMFRRVYDICFVGAVVGLAACFAGSLSAQWWDGWPRLPAMWSVSHLLSLVCQDVLYNPGSLTVSARLMPSDLMFTGLEIAPLCSGYEAIGLLLVLSGAYLVRSRHWLGFRRSVLIIALASLVVWSAIVFRIFALVLLAQLSLQGAVNAAHSQTTWMLFNVLTLAIIMAADRMFRRHALAAASGTQRFNRTVHL